MEYERRCFAKINLYLKILGRRDDGYHQLDTLFQEINLSETLHWLCDDGPFRLEIVGADAGPLEQNLITRAVRAFEAASGVVVGGRFCLNKQIPIGGGLGGGSANAAQTLLLLNQHFGSPLTATHLAELALALGADVPFFLMGGTCRAGGVGEVLEPVTCALPWPGGFLIFPPFGVPTGPVFRALAAPVYDAALDRPSPRLGENDLWAPAASLFPELARLAEAWPRGADEPLFMTGSGSTLVHLCAGGGDDSARRAVLKAFGARCVPFSWQKRKENGLPLEKRGGTTHIKIL